MNKNMFYEYKICLEFMFLSIICLAMFWKRLIFYSNDL